MSIKILAFPHEIRTQPERPCIKFEAFDRMTNENPIIILPSPPSISFNDSADFNTIDLGAVGGVAANAAQNGIWDTIKSTKVTQILKAVASKTPASEMSNLVTKSVVNPNTNASFTGNKMRNFGFNFKLIAKSAKESEIIYDIHSMFRHYTYASMKPGKSNMTLDFPPVWTIKFVDLNFTTGENPYIPRIYSCYLTQVESTFNSDANMYFNDSAPLQVDISLQFQETRVLTRNDIENMENDKFADRGIDENGNPKLTSPASQKEQTPEK